jgi:hypothetical protein
VEIHTIFEGFESHFGQEGGFGTLDNLSFDQDLNVFQDFDLPFVNFGGDFQSVEETNLRGVHSSGSGGDGNGDGGDDSDFSDGIDSVGFNNGEEFEDGSFRNDQTKFSFKAISEDLKFGFSLESELLKIFEIEVFFIEVLDSRV